MLDVKGLEVIETGGMYPHVNKMDERLCLRIVPAKKIWIATQSNRNWDRRNHFCVSKFQLKDYVLCWTGQYWIQRGKAQNWCDVMQSWRKKKVLGNEIPERRIQYSCMLRTAQAQIMKIWERSRRLWTWEFDMLLVFASKHPEFWVLHTWGWPWAGEGRSYQKIPA